MNKLSEYQNNFVKHGCEQVLRFSQVEQWDDLAEAVKVQFGFNMGVVAVGLELSKEDGFSAFANMREGQTAMEDFRAHLQSLIAAHGIEIDDAQVARPF